MEQFDEVGRYCQWTKTLLPGTWCHACCRKLTAPLSSSPLLSVSSEHGQRSEACPMAAACSLTVVCDGWKACGVSQSLWGSGRTRVRTGRHTACWWMHILIYIWLAATKKHISVIFGNEQCQWSTMQRLRQAIHYVNARLHDLLPTSLTRAFQKHTHKCKRAQHSASQKKRLWSFRGIINLRCRLWFLMLGLPPFLPVHIDDRVVSCPSFPPRKEKKRNERSNTHRHVPFSTRKTPLTGDTANQKYEMFPVLCCRTHHHLFVCAKRILYAGILNPKLLQRFAHYLEVTLVRKSGFNYLHSSRWLLACFTRHCLLYCGVSWTAIEYSVALQVALSINVV